MRTWQSYETRELHARRGPSFTKRVVNPDVCARASPSGHLSCYALSPSLEPRLLCAGSQPRDHSHKTASQPLHGGGSAAGQMPASCRAPAPGAEMRPPAPDFKIIKVSSLVPKV